LVEGGEKKWEVQEKFAKTSETFLGGGFLLGRNVSPWGGRKKKMPSPSVEKKKKKRGDVFDGGNAREGKAQKTGEGFQNARVAKKTRKCLSKKKKIVGHKKKGGGRGCAKKKRKKNGILILGEG